jgi:3-(3-hydroxy-phenyl)propionate hydroxylase
MSDTVIIAGGGPAGLMLACELRLAGAPATVLEPRTERPEMSAGMAIHGRTLETFRRRGLAGRIRDEDISQWPLTPFALLWLDMSAAPDIDHTYAFPQWRTERLLAGRAAELGADIRAGHELVGLRQDETGVTVDARSGAGSYQLRGAYLVGCDGRESRVRELAGIEFPARGDTYHGMFGDLVISPDIDDQFSAVIQDGGVFGAMPLDARILRLMTLEFGVEPPAAGTPVTEDELMDAIERISGHRPAVRGLRAMSRFGGPTRLAASYRAGRVFLAGDAAHSLFISGTQGLHTSIHDAVNLGWKLAAAVTGWAPDGLLDSYQAERLPVGERMAWHAHASLAMLHPLGRVSQLRELVSRLLTFEDANRHLLRMTTEVAYSWPDTVTAAGVPAHPLLGRMVPEVAVGAADGTDPVDRALRAGRGVLLDLSGGAADISGAAAWAGRVDIAAVAPAPGLDAASLLIRPDGYVAYAGTDPDSAGLSTALATWFGEPALATAGSAMATGNDSPAS